MTAWFEPPADPAEAEHDIARGWIARGVAPDNVARWLGFDVEDLPAIAAGRPPRGRDRWCPTPDEIAARATAIRAGWSPRERRQRAAGRVPGPGFDGPPVPQCFRDGDHWTAVG